MSKKSHLKENGVLTVNQSNSEVLLENVSTSNQVKKQDGTGTVKITLHIT
jgi:hypothetical protein